MHSVHYSQKAKEGGKSDDVFLMKTKLAVQASEGDEQALKELIRLYHPAIKNIAFRYKHDSVTLDELIQEGRVAMWEKVALKFDSDKAGNFDAFVSRCLHSAIFSYANQMRHRPLNRSLIAGRNYLLKEMHRYELEFGRPMTEGEMVEYMNRDSDRRYDMEAIRRILNYNIPNTHTSSLSESCFDDSSETKEDRLICSNPLPDAHLETQEIKKLVRERVDAALNRMPTEKKDIVKARISLNKDHREPTLQELGDIYGFTREWIRQIENTGRKCIKNKLKHDPVMQEVSGFFA